MKTPRPSRRFFLRAAGVSLGLPFLESLPKKVSFGAIEQVASSTVDAKRMVCIGNMLGFYPPTFIPETAGRDYELSRVLSPLKDLRKDFSVISGLDHGVKGGHFAIHAFLSGVRAVDAKSMPDANISLDQFAAEQIGGFTRFPSLTIGSEDGLHGGCQMCWTRSGTRVPPIEGPRELFQKLFVEETPAAKARASDRILLHASILDSVLSDANSLQKKLNARDQAKLDEYLTSVRDIEKQLELDKKWTKVPKPKAEMEEPEDEGMVSDLPELYDLIALALQTDSTRIATLEIAGGFEVVDLGFRKDYHALSHHGQVQESIDALIAIETYQIEQFSRFLSKLKSIEMGEANMLDKTMVLFGSGMGNANSHTNSNLPIVLSGGNFKHGQHVQFDPKSRTRPPLANLYVSMLQELGVESDRFATSTGTLTGIEKRA
jgi:Protein of unknown function (DUF1552)